jgi:hypothetical protein
MSTKVSANTQVHIGPGTFTTLGYRQGSATWQMRPGLKIVGSGVDVTTVKLDTGLPTSVDEYFAFGHDLITGSPATPNPMDLSEISDLTIDCNLAAQTNQVSVGAKLTQPRRTPP